MLFGRGARAEPGAGRNSALGEGFSAHPFGMRDFPERVRVTYIDGEAGMLLYRGYPVEQLAEKSTFMEVAYLVLHGDLPNKKQLDEFTGNIGSDVNQFMMQFFFLVFHHGCNPVPLDINDTHKGKTDKDENDSKIFLQEYMYLN